MEAMQTEQYAPRPDRFSRYDRRLILKVVQEVEEGLPEKKPSGFMVSGPQPFVHGCRPMIPYITSNILKETVTAILKSASL